MSATGYDMIVVGGGPAGSMAALTAAEKGLDVLLIERDLVIGHPVRCAEGVDARGLGEFFEADKRWISAHITAYNLVAPDGTVVAMDTCGADGFILERLVFDRMVAERAASAGASVMTGVEAFAMSPYEDGVRTVKLRNRDREWEVGARIVVAADGVESRVARWAGIDTASSAHDMETCAQATCSGIDIDPHAFSLFYGRGYAPGGYAWVFPKGDRTANVGLGISGDESAKRRPEAFLDDFIADRFPGAAVVSRTVGGVPCSGGLKRIVADGLMIAGDAAHMANPITGGGIINALIAGKYAGETAAAALERTGKAEERSLGRYSKQCDRRFGAMNRRCWRLKEATITFPDERLNKLAADIVRLPLAKRTPIRVLTTALMNRPELLLVLAKVVF